MKVTALQLWLFLHVAGVAVWIGGMVFAHFCLRPSVADLQPAQRAPLMVATLGRFFDLVTASLVLIWASGLAMMMDVGFASAPVGWHLMMGIAAAMTAIFAWIRGRHFPDARRAVAIVDLPAAAAALDRIRRLVLLNLVLGFVVIAIATLIG